MAPTGCHFCAVKTKIFFVFLSCEKCFLTFLDKQYMIKKISKGCWISLAESKLKCNKTLYLIRVMPTEEWKYMWKSIIFNFILLILLICFWQLICSLEIVPNYVLPSPLETLKAFIINFYALMEHAKISLLETFLGIAISVFLGFIISILMDSFNFLYKSFYPILVVSQTIPTIAIAPLLVLWMGYGIAPKIALIVMVCFFPITISLLGRV